MITVKTKKASIFLLLVILTGSIYAQTEEDYRRYAFVVDSIEHTLTYQYGTISLQNGVGKITIPHGFKYLDAKQAEWILVELWGNPKYDRMTLGFILPENKRILDEHGYVFNIEYDEIGYVKDDDAEDIDYDELLKQIKEGEKTENEERIKDGYEPVLLIGWAAKPFYDKKQHSLHWAKELKFGDDEINTLNYNIRILGRKKINNMPTVQLSNN
jgi:uncharacterized membrane-anchored protein